MSARDEVYEWLTSPGLVGLRQDDATSLLDRYRDEVWHEAAEEIRTADFGDPWLVGYGQQYAADLIDTKPKENRS